MLGSFVQVVLNALGKILPFILTWFAAKDSAKKKQLEKTVEVMNEAKKTIRDTENMSSSERAKFMQKYKRKL